MQAAAEQDDVGLTHGFHTYPARMHSAIARRLLQDFRPAARPRVLDPFCGSGTVLVEALVAGYGAVGHDLNPLAMRIAAVHCRPGTAAEREQLRARVKQVAAASEARVRARVPIRAPLPRAEVVRYAPHVLLELAGLHAEIVAVEEEALRQTLEVVFSALVVKFSRQRADTSEHLVDKRIRKGLVTEFFVRKADELCQRWQALSAAVPAPVGELHLIQGDIRDLPRRMRPEQRVDLVLTSPPYGGTYDYVQHHARRYPWLGLSSAQFAARELGARRRLNSSADGPQRWDEELAEALSAIARVSRYGANVLLLMGDAQLGERRVDAAAQLARIAPTCGMRWIAAAAQSRPDFRGGEVRREHLVCLEVTPRPTTATEERRGPLPSRDPARGRASGPSERTARAKGPHAGARGRRRVRKPS